MIKEALNHAHKLFKYEYDRFSLADAKRLDMIKIGVIGELVFREYLMRIGSSFVYQDIIGKYDEFDFKVNGKKVEIKTSGYDYYPEDLNLLYNVEQYNHGLKKGTDFVYLVLVNGYNRRFQIFNSYECNTAILAGWIPFRQIPKKGRIVTSWHDDCYLINQNQLYKYESVDNIQRVIKEKSDNRFSLK